MSAERLDFALAGSCHQRQTCSVTVVRIILLSRQTKLQQLCLFVRLEDGFVSRASTRSSLCLGRSLDTFAQISRSVVPEAARTLPNTSETALTVDGGSLL